jgi:hypothetical protein
MLYRPEAFEPLVDSRWNERRVHGWDNWHATSP